jgi:hypothetical protein
MSDATPHTRDSLIARIQAMAGDRSRVGRREFERETRISRFQIIKLFGSYSGFIEAAGLARARNLRLDDDTLLRALRNACLASGGIVSQLHVADHGGRSTGAYIRRWGTWRNVLVALRGWIERHDPGFAFLSALPQASEQTPLVLLPRPALPPRYGAPINYRGILHEPTNEAGVILLFGAMAQELGFAVERVTAAFPDCEAKRRLSGGWQRTRIEFEYESRNFDLHGHDPTACDLIVCWEHNWVDCPLEVLELKQEVAKRAGNLSSCHART